MADLDWTFTNNREMTEEMFNAALKRGLEAIGMQAESYAKLEVNQTRNASDGHVGAIKTGRLINSITYGMDGRSGTHRYRDNQGKSYTQQIGLAEEDSVYIGTNVEYAPYIEFGHHSYPAVHYLKNAAGNHSEEYRNILEESLKNA